MYKPLKINVCPHNNASRSFVHGWKRRHLFWGQNTN